MTLISPDDILDDSVDTRRYWLGVALLVLVLIALSTLVAVRGGVPRVRALTLIPSAGSVTSVQPQVRVRFARAMDRASVEPTVRIEPDVPFELSWNEAELRILLQAPLQAEQTYNVTVGPGLSDAEGTPLEGRISWQFSTRRPRVAYITREGELWLTETSGDERSLLTAPGQYVQSVTTTADGSTLVYTVAESETATNMWRMDMGGGGWSQLTEEQNLLFNAPQFSPAGDLLVVESRRLADVGGTMTLTAPDIELRRPTDGSPAGLVYGQEDETAHSARWSPAGTRLAFVESTRNEVAIYNFTTDLLAFPAESASFSQQVWSPDGNAITYSRFLITDAGVKQVAMIRDIQLGTEIPLMEYEGDLLAPAWHPDGTAIAFVAVAPQNSGQADGVWIADTFGPDRRPRISEPGIIYVEPQWSPDGEWLLYGRVDPSNPNGEQSLWMIRRDGTDTQLLVEEGYKALWIP